MRIATSPSTKPEKKQRWVVVIPPEGAARSLGWQCFTTMREILGKENCKKFDCKNYLDFFEGSLKIADNEIVVDLTNQSLLTSTLDFSATHVLVIALSPITLFNLNLLRKQSIFTIHWFCEDFRIVDYWKEVIRGYDLFATMQRGPLEELCRHYNTAFLYLPAATSIHTNDLLPWNQRKEVIAFIGIPSRFRIKVLEKLKKDGKQLLIAGQGWEDYQGPLKNDIRASGWVDQSEWMKFLQECKVGINLPVYHNQEDIHNDQISPRVLDILASGCNLVSTKMGLLNQLIGEDSYYGFEGLNDVSETANNALKGNFLPGHTHAPMQANKVEPKLVQNPKFFQKHHGYTARINELLNYGFSRNKSNHKDLN